jgi:hypothetical protein
MAMSRESSGLIKQRLLNQGIAAPTRRRPADVVAWLGAVQAQEYQPAKWALGLRIRDATDAAVERAVEDGEILRTHVMRPTWHFVAAPDLRWMQALTGPHVQRLMRNYQRQLELEPAMLTRAAALFERALRDRQYLTRPELAERLVRAGMHLAGVRMAHATMHAELEAVICSGPRRGKVATYGLVAERAPDQRDLSGDEALAELTRRFFRSHGPATIRDFVWWSGLATSAARRGLDIIRAKHEELGGCTYYRTAAPSAIRGAKTAVHLLPIYDEYLVAYRDRLLVPHGPSKVAAVPGHTVTFQHALVIDGRVAGTWRIRKRTPRQLAIEVTPLRRLTAAERRGVVSAGECYQRFLESPVAIVFG